MIKGISDAERRSFNEKHTDRQGLLNRAAVCDFMAATSSTTNGRKLWEISARRRRAEAARLMPA